jgi:hypothetical protein
MSFEKKSKFVKKVKNQNEMFRMAINSELLSRLKHIKEVSKDDIDVNKTLENKIYSVVIALESKYGISSNDWKTQRICPKCNGLLKLVTGKNGVFIGCSSFPKCSYTESASK